MFVPSCVTQKFRSRFGFGTFFFSLTKQGQDAIIKTERAPLLAVSPSLSCNKYYADRLGATKRSASFYGKPSRGKAFVASRYFYLAYTCYTCYSKRKERMCLCCQSRQKKWSGCWKPMVLFLFAPMGHIGSTETRKPDARPSFPITTRH